MRDRKHFFFLNVGHFLDHLFMLIFATVAALVLAHEWGMTYGQLIPYATPGFVAFGVFAVPAGWLADRWSREGMMAVFFAGAGIAAILTGFAQTPLQIGLGLFVVGVFAAIYHPVGLALVAAEKKGLGMAIAINGVWGNLGVGCAALFTGYLIETAGWRSAFIVPGLVSIGFAVAYVVAFHERVLSRNNRVGKTATAQPVQSGGTTPMSDEMRALLLRVTIVILCAAALASFIFQGTTFALPKVFDERLGGIAESAKAIGFLAFIVFAVASVGQLVVGSLLDRVGARGVLMGVVLIQIVFFSSMPGLTDWAAVVVALGFMLGAFGQIPINDYLIGQVAKSELRASIYGARYLLSFMVLAASIPFIAWVHSTWGFDMLFRLLTGAAVVLLPVAFFLPNRLPTSEPIEKPAEARA
jgi:MFS family permease